MNDSHKLSDDRVSERFAPWRDASRWWIAFSGGMDSSVLLDLSLRALSIWRQRGEQCPQLTALHVDHGLSPQHAAWVAHCRSSCDALGVALQVETVSVDARGSGLEQAARDARYRVFETILAPTEVLLQGHHEDDQGETLLYRLMRGCGVKGAAAIPVERALGAGRLARPLLDLPRETLLEYARAAALHWIEDESNVETRFDRNFLRHEVIPLLQQRWPKAGNSLARFAGHASEQALIAEDLAALDLDAVLSADARYGGSLGVETIMSLPQHRRYNLYRHCFALLGIEAQGRLRYEEVDALLRESCSAAQIQLPGYSLRLHRAALFAIDERALSELPRPRQLVPWQPGKTPAEGFAGELRCRRFSPTDPGAAAQQGLREQGYSLGLRQPGAVARINGQGKSLKKLLQELGVPAWLRDVMPIVYQRDAGGDGAACVAAVPGYVIADDFRQAGGYTLEWRCPEINALQAAVVPAD